MSPASTMDVAQAHAVRLMQHLVVPTFVLNSKRQVVIWNRACERLTGVMAAEVLGTNQHWRAFYETKRYCLADLVALERPDKLAQLYSQYAIPDDGVGFSAESWCVMPKSGNQLYLAIDAAPIPRRGRQADRRCRDLARHDRSKARGGGVEDAGVQRWPDRPRQSAIIRSEARDGMGPRGKNKKAIVAVVGGCGLFQTLQRSAWPSKRRRVSVRGGRYHRSRRPFVRPIFRLDMAVKNSRS